MIVLIFCLVLLTVVASAAYLMPLLTTSRPASGRATSKPAGNGSRNRNRRRNRRVTFTPDPILRGRWQPNRNTKCAHCRGPILKGEACLRTRDRHGLICPGCHMH